MIIIHCLRQTTWERYKSKDYYGIEYIEAEGFIHCSEINTFANVAPNFIEVTDGMLILCIDTGKVQPEIKWENGDNSGTSYPHIYGLLNMDAIVEVLPYLKDSIGNWIVNDELKKYV